MQGKQKDPNNNNQQKKTVADDLFDALNPNNMLNNAQRVLSSAVNVLEEEIAAGILAAKKIEKKVIDVDDVRNNPENLLNRIRKDTHEVVDLFLDSMIALSSQLKIFTDTVEKQNGTTKTAAAPAEKKQNDNITILQQDTPVEPGETVALFMNFSNDNEETTSVKIQLQKADLQGSLNEKIASRNIDIKPAIVILNPGESREVSIHVKVPSNCKHGHYTALFTDAQNPLIKALINIEVA
jgi:hypothetical protein